MLTRRSACALAAAAALAALLAPGASAASPAERWPADGSAVTTARQIARDFWQTDPCSGQVSVTWQDLRSDINAVARWTNAWAAYGRTDNFACRIELNALQAAWSWPKLCTVIVHEYGHLAGRPHNPDQASVMHPVYMGALEACAHTPEPDFEAPVTFTGPARPAGRATVTGRQVTFQIPRRLRRAAAAGALSVGCGDQRATDVRRRSATITGTLPDAAQVSTGDVCWVRAARRTVATATMTAVVSPAPAPTAAPTGPGVPEPVLSGTLPDPLPAA